MKYCENCHVATDDERCPLCDGKKLREVGGDDFCLLTKVGSGYGASLMEIFDEEKIPYSAMPYGSGVETQLGLPLQNYRLFVPYSFLNAAQNIIDEIESAETQRLREYLLAHQDEYNVLPKVERKTRKKGKLSQDTDFFDYCTDIVKASDFIREARPCGGRLSSKGHYIFVYKENVILSVDSATFEIIAIDYNK